TRLATVQPTPARAGALGGGVLPPPAASTDTPARREQTPVDRAFALGWHVAELTYLQDDKPQAPDWPGRLKLVNNLDFDSRAELLLSQICTGIAQINADGVQPPKEIQDLVQMAAGAQPLTTAHLTR